MTYKRFPQSDSGRIASEPRGLKREREKVYETQEWTIIVFLCGQDRGKKVIHPDPVYNTPPDRDWARHPCCGTVCVMRSAPLCKITNHERFGAAPL